MTNVSDTLLCTCLNQLATAVAIDLLSYKIDYKIIIDLVTFYNSYNVSSTH